jgi:alginate O-acetyltransferase complex protein AlgI
MVFSSVSFLFFFLPVCLAGYAVVGKRLRNAWLLLMSLLFYTWGGGALVTLLLASTVLHYAAGLLVASGHRTGNPRRVRAGVIGSVTVSLAMLGYFKYANFVVAQINSLGAHLGWGDIAWTSVVLPIGISFFTFQSMSYTLDLARNRVEPMRNLLDFALFVALFPQLIAGPIVRYHEIADQLEHRRVGVDRFAEGALRFVHGLAKKVLIADAVAPIADAAFGAGGANLSAAAAWIGVIAYTVQIYFDFSGYSDMAIGLGRLFGFEFPENFRRPYSAVSITDFWRRWHITLSNWFRDYLYIPLGGSRAGPGRTYLNLWIVFLLVGFWHGANWTFVVWGAYHGALLASERLFGQRPVDPAVAWAPLRRAVILLAVMVGWVVFRAPDIGAAVSYLGAMVGSGTAPIDPFAGVFDIHGVIALTVGCASFLLPGSFVGGIAITRLRGATGWTLRFAELFIAFPYTLVLVATGTFSPFLYYQF